MHKIKWLLVAGFVLILTFSVSTVNANVSENSDLPEDGILINVFYEEKDFTENMVQIAETNGYSAKSSLVEEDEELKGEIVINEDGKERIYSLKSTDNVNKNDRVVYTGLVDNGDLSFEAFLTEDRESMTINIFGLKDEKADFEAYENRINPFTVRFNKDKSLINVTTEIFSEDKMSVNSRVNNMGLYEIIERHLDGLSFSVQTVLNRSNESPLILRSWTDEEGAKKYSNQPQPTTAWIREAAFVQSSRMLGTYFVPASPSQSGVTSFELPFSWRGVQISIPVNVSETILNNDAFENPLQLNLIWNLKRANSFEFGDNNEGIAQMSEYKHDGRKNSDGRHEVDISFQLLYELVGNEREYIPIGLDGTAYFD